MCGEKSPLLHDTAIIAILSHPRVKCQRKSPVTGSFLARSRFLAYFEADSARLQSLCLPLDVCRHTQKSTSQVGEELKGSGTFFGPDTKIPTENLPLPSILPLSTPNITINLCQSVLQTFKFSFFMRVFHAAMFVSPFISTAEADINAQANFCPLAVSISRSIAKPLCPPNADFDLFISPAAKVENPTSRAGLINAVGCNTLTYLASVGGCLKRLNSFAEGDSLSPYPGVFQRAFFIEHILILCGCGRRPPQALCG